MRRLFNIRVLVVSLSQFQFVKKGTNTAMAHFQDNDTSRLQIFNMGQYCPHGGENELAHGGKISVQLLASLQSTTLYKQIYSIFVILKFHGRRDDLGKMSKKAH